MVPLATGGGPERGALRRAGARAGEAHQGLALAERLRGRRGEIEQTVLARVRAISDPGEVADPLYAEGLRAAVGAALDYALEVIERGEGSPPPVPLTLLAQARLAARHGVGLDTVLRRYSAGYMLFSDFLLAEAEETGVGGAELQRLLRALAVIDRLYAAVAEEYNREAAERPPSGAGRRLEQVRRLLAGELVETSGLGYDLDAHHTAIVATGEGAAEAIREAARRLDRRLLSVGPAEETVWAWLGGCSPADPAEALGLLGSSLPRTARLALGEPGEGPDGWRLSHRQALAALPVAQRGSEPAVRYADIALLAAVLKDELLRTSLRRLYLEPLEAERDGGEVLRATLRAYFAASRNVSSAAVALGVKRETIGKRLRATEVAVRRPLEGCAAELEVALRLALLDHPA